MNFSPKSQEVKANIEQKLSRLFGTTAADASREQMYKAVVQTVKDILAEKRSEFKATTNKQGGKRVYYMCMEFLLGRSLKTNLCNLGLSEEYKKALTDLYFAPTDNNKNNLLKELVPEEKIFVTGNTVIDAVRLTVTDDYQFQTEALQTVDFSKGRVILLTAHRRENLGEPMQHIFSAVRRMVEAHEDVQVIYPMHLNPAVREPAKAILGGHNRIHLIDPVDVEELHNLMNRCYFVMTDSGGLQEEAPSLGKPVLVLRSETERPEAVYAGTVKIAGTEEETILSMANELLENEEAYAEMSRAINPYGDGQASRRIVDAILYAFGKQDKPEEWVVE